jgi:hypothetical protein
MESYIEMKRSKLATYNNMDDFSKIEFQQVHCMIPFYKALQQTILIYVLGVKIMATFRG